jgi:hypothetical protein
LLRWLQAKFGPHVFEHTDESVSTFLGVVRTARSFSTLEPKWTMPVAVFFYPTSFVLEELLRHLPLAKMRVVVVLDDVFCVSARALRKAPKTSIAFVKPLKKEYMIDVMHRLAATWHLGDQCSEYWRARAGSDPRQLLNLLFFERLQRQTSGCYDVDLNWNWYKWVKFWCTHGPRNMLELTFDQPSKTGLKLEVPGVLAKYETEQALTMLVWDYVSADLQKRAVKRRRVEPNMADVDTAMALKYLHYIAPKMFTVVEAGPTPMENVNGCADAVEMLSLADLQQSRFEPQISYMHQQAVHYGLRRVRRHNSLLKVEEFYAFVSAQRQARPDAWPIHDFAPVVLLHKSDTLDRLLFMADPEHTMADYWPTPAPTLAGYVQQWDLQPFGALPQLQLVAWRLILAWLARAGPVPQRPRPVRFREGVWTVLRCAHGRPLGFSACVNCNTAPTEEVMRCADFCKGKWACMRCRAYNEHIAQLVLRGRALEKI